MDEPIENLYFSWLCAKVSRVENPTPSLTYWKLFRALYRNEFVWLVSGDDSRALDGLELREEFFRESGIPEDPVWESMNCSIFEMLISFSRRAQFNAGETSAFWFWKMLENLGLREANDASFREEEVEEVLYNLVWRNYDRRGHGGLFPMNNPQHDQRHVEVWYQFCEYLVDQDWPL
jgi:hypothetical protein